MDMLSFAEYLIFEGTYLDVGHKGEPYHLWLYAKGKFHKSEEFPENDKTGHDYFNQEGIGNDIDYSTDTYAGRYEPRTGRVSVARPYEKRHLEVPSHVMNHIFKQFPKISKVHVY